MSKFAGEKTRQELLDETWLELKRKNAGPEETAVELFALRAAMFLIDGPEEKLRFGDPDKREPQVKEEPENELPMNEEDSVLRIDPVNAADEDAGESYLDVGKVRELAGQLKKKPELRQYLRDNYEYAYSGKNLNEDGEPIDPQEEMKVEGFLLAKISPFDVPEDDRAQLELRQAEMRRQIDSRRPTFREYWDFKCPGRNKAIPGSPYREKNESVYEYEPTEDDCRLFGAVMHVVKGDGGKQVTFDEWERIKALPLTKLTLRNPQTIEKLRRGESGPVAQAAVDVHKSFTFSSKEELKAAQENARRLLDGMYKRSGRAAALQDWRDLSYAIHRFTEAESPEKAKKCSAEVLLAVESFTKGRKSIQDGKTQACVDDALSALAVCIPDAAKNPSVKPLIGRFNQVRGWHIGQPAVNLNDYLPDKDKIIGEEPSRSESAESLQSKSDDLIIKP